MLMTKERPRAIRTLRGWAIHVLQEAGATAGCRTAPTRTPANGPSISPGAIRRPIFRRSQPSRKSQKSWTA